MKVRNRQKVFWRDYFMNEPASYTAFWSQDGGLNGEGVFEIYRELRALRSGVQDVAESIRRLAETLAPVGEESARRNRQAEEYKELGTAFSGKVKLHPRTSVFRVKRFD
jgi:hypothetical protein